jgi:hypothetical protein
MEAFPSLNSLLVVGFVFLVSFTPNTPLDPSLMMFGLMLHTESTVVHSFGMVMDGRTISC